MKKTLTLMAALALLILVSAAPATARTTEDVSDSTGTRADPSRSVIVKATGLLQRRGVTAYRYGTHRITDVKTRRPYALKSSRYPGLLDRHVGKWVTVYGVLVPGFPRGSGPPLLDVVRVFPPSGYPPLKK